MGDIDWNGDGGDEHTRLSVVELDGSLAEAQRFMWNVVRGADKSREDCQLLQNMTQGVADRL